MAQIIILQGDAELLGGVECNLTAKTIEDYVYVYDQIAQALHSGKSLTVSVSDRTVAAWLKRMQEQYGAAQFEFKTLTLRGKLKDQWHLDIPAWVTDEQIRQAELLKVNITADPGRDFEDFVLEIFFSPYLAKPRFPLSLLDDFLGTYDHEQWEKNRARPLLKTILQRRFKQWDDDVQLQAEKRLIEWLDQNPEILKEKLTLFKVLEGYGVQMGQRVMGDDFKLMLQLELDLQLISVNETEVADALDQIRLRLEQLRQLQDTEEALNAILNSASGVLEIEFDFVQSLLQRGDLTIDGNLVNRVRKLFAPIQDRPQLDQSLADLDLLISQERPPDPLPDWDEQDWLDWAVGHYLPYRYWLEEIGQLKGDIVDLADTYAEWLYNYYPAARLSSPKMIYQALPKMRSIMLESSVTLVIVVDNFNTKFLRDFRRYMQDAGFFSRETSYYICMLPSCTEISKKCLITGQPEPFSGTSYEGPVVSKWEAALQGKKVKYLPHIGALRRIKEREHNVYFLNYLPLDIALHQDEQLTGISHPQAVRTHLRALTLDVKAFGERVGAERDLVVIVLSDHGSTRIPADEPNPIDPSFFAKRVKDKHHRYVSINDREFSDLPENVQYQCYTFERNKFDLDDNYMAAKRHYRFIPTSESIYVHGGLTPEETIVPMALFEPIKVTPKPIQIGLLDNEFYYGRRSQLRFELVNTNSYACKNVRLEIMNPSLDVPVIDLDDLEPMSQKEVVLESRFRRGRDELNYLDIRLTYTFLGEPHQQLVETLVIMKKMMEQAFNLDELL